jgi:PAS domain S-box-containing protein
MRAVYDFYRFEAASGRIILETLVEMKHFIIDQARDAIVGLDLAGEITYCNQSAGELLAYDDKELIGKNQRCLMPDEDIDDFDVAREAILFNKNPEPFQTHRLTKHNERVAVSVQYSPMTNNEGMLVGISQVIRKLNPFEKASSKAQDLLETAPDAMVIVNQLGQIVLVNAQTESLFLYRKEELLGKTVEILIPDTFIKNHKQYREQYIHHPRTRSMGQGMELHGKQKDGSTFPVEVSLSPLKTDEGTFISAAIRDISDRKNAESKFRKLLESAPDAMVIVTEAGVIQLVNAQVANIFGYEKAEIIGNKVEMLIPGRFRPQHGGHRKSFFSNPKMRPMGAELELFGLHKDGHEFPVEISLSPLETEEGVLVSAAIRDISKRKETEKALHSYNTQLQIKNKELEQFAYVASHDLQEPLRTVKNFVKLINKQYSGEFDEKAVKYFEFISQATTRMEELVVGLLNYSRIGQNKKMSTIDCQKLIQEIQQDLSSRIKETNTRIELGKMPEVRAYRTELRLLFQNLITNAIKFRNRETAPRIKILAKKGNDCWQFEVQDNGIGIAEKHYKKIFVIFQRLHTQDEYDGTGIGLAHCQKIVDLHGGKIWVNSTLGKGSTFNFTIQIEN